MSTPNGADQGLWATSKRIIDTLLGTVENRVELFATEVHEEKCRLVEAMLCAAAVAACGMMALTVVTLTVVLYFWDNGRIPALVLLSLIYLVGTGVAWRSLRIRLRRRTAFGGTLHELNKDRSCLRAEN
jgi:uncharacterized membrane protein YqjE